MNTSLLEAENNLFNYLKETIKMCSECDFDKNNGEPIYFGCNDLNEVMCLIITEQPRDKGDNVTELTFKNILRKDERNNNDTVAKLKKILSSAFARSVVEENGPFYWTHCTKCPSKKDEFKQECLKYLFAELNVFPNLKCIISFGSKAFKALSEIFPQIKNNFYEYLWEEIELIVKQKNEFPEEMYLEYTNPQKKVLLIVLPHPSPKNPLSNFLPKFQTFIDRAIKSVKKKED